MKALLATYDAESDVMYVSLGSPVPAYGVNKEGLLLLYAYDSDAICGVTVEGFKARNRLNLTKKLSLRLNVSVDLVNFQVNLALSSKGLA